MLRLVKEKTKIISTTGHTSRELMKIRAQKKLKKGKDFYMVGGMGHANSVSLGMCLQSKKQVVCLDGDGSLLMHLGSMFTSGFSKKNNLKHILLNNNAHESVGGQTTGAKSIKFDQLSKSLGYKNYFRISRDGEIIPVLKGFLKSTNSSFLEVLIKLNLLHDLPRPKNLIKIKNYFMK